MKYKALLAGKNNSVIDDFFSHMGESMEALTSSIRFEDVVRHLQYFKPDFFVYCIYNESKEAFNRMTNIKYQLTKWRIPFILIGSREDCEEFAQQTTEIADLTLHKPMTAEAVESNIISFVRKWKAAQKKKTGEQQGKTKENVAAAVQVSAEEEERKHILIVDDSPIMLKTLKEQLRDKYDIATAISGKVAMKFLERKRTDLILLDYEMPEENGPAVLEKLRANRATKNLPVIFLTGVTDSGKIREALVLKPQGYLLKPINYGKLIEAITNAIG